MPADFSRYVNLTIHDVDPGQMYRQMIEVARTVMPELNLRRGTLEDAMLQSVAYAGSIATNAINRVPDGLMEGLVGLFGYERNIGSRAVATATVVMYGTSGAAIPLGTEFRYRYVDTVTGTQRDYLFVASEDSIITAGSPPSGTISLTCSTFGEIPAPTNGTTTLTPLSVDTDINTVTFATFTNGTNPLTNQEYLDSARTYLQSISTTFVTAKQLESAVLANFPYVSRCKVYDLMDGDSDRGVITFTPNTALNASSSSYKGYTSIFVYGFDGPLSNTQLTEIQSFAAERTMAGLDISVFNFQTVTLAESLTKSSNGVYVVASYDSSYDSSVVESEIQQSIAEFLSPQSYPYEELSVSSPRLRDSTIISRLLSTVPGLLYVSSVQFTPATNPTYTVTSASQTASGTDGTVITASSTGDIVNGQRVRLGGTTYAIDSTNVSLKTSTTFTITSANYSSVVSSATAFYPHFHETTSATTLNFLNRGVLPSITTSNISVDLTSETT